MILEGCRHTFDTGLGLWPFFMNRITYSGGWPLLHCKKRLADSPSPTGMSQTKLFLAENNLTIPSQVEFG